MLRLSPLPFLVWCLVWLCLSVSTHFQIQILWSAETPSSMHFFSDCNWFSMLLRLSGTSGRSWGGSSGSSAAWKLDHLLFVPLWQDLNVLPHIQVNFIHGFLMSITSNTHMNSKFWMARKFMTPPTTCHFYPKKSWSIAAMVDAWKHESIYCKL